MTLGYLIMGLVLLRYLLGLFYAVDNEIRASPAMKTVMGFVLIIAFFVAILLTAMTVVGLPIALITTLLVVVALMLTGIFFHSASIAGLESN
jgi:FtsH-binding integral membrane protein